METICTICSREKNEATGLLPAVQRYTSARIDYVSQESRRLGKPFLIFSGKFGLIDAGAEIPWYDQRLDADAVEGMVPVLVSQLREKGVSGIIFYSRPPGAPGWRPYCEALERACHQLGIAIDYRLVD